MLKLNDTNGVDLPDDAQIKALAAKHEPKEKNHG